MTEVNWLKKTVEVLAPYLVDNEDWTPSDGYGCITYQFQTLFKQHEDYEELGTDNEEEGEEPGSDSEEEGEETEEKVRDLFLFLNLQNKFDKRYVDLIKSWMNKAKTYDPKDKQIALEILIHVTYAL